MKSLFAFLVSALLCQVGAAAPVHAKRVQAELGSALGFQIYRFEANLGTDEVLIVRERIVDRGKVSESEFAAVGTHVPVVYEIVLVDSGAFHPSLRNTYMLRSPSSNGYIENLRLSHWGDTAEGGVGIDFNEVDTNQPARTLTWSAKVEKYAEVKRRWPELPAPRSNGWSGSSRMIKDE